MASSPPVVAIEVGTTKVAALVGEIRDNGRLMITGMGEHASKGVRKGEVIDLDNAVVCVRGALHGAEETGQVVIRQVHVAMSGSHIQSQVNRGVVRVMDSSGEITEADVEQVMDIARTINLPPERELLHTICQHFCVDDQESVVNPVGLEGAKLSLDMLALHGVRSRMHNTIKVVQSVPMDVADVAFSGLCSALAVLTPEQKEIGALVIDMGGGTTDFVVYADKTLADAGSLGIGGDHITNDVAQAFRISLGQAEILKHEAGSALADASSCGGRVKVPPEVGFEERSVSLPALHRVINARVEEVFEMVKDRIKSGRILRRIGAGVVLTGGGARLTGIVKLAENVFGVPGRIGRPQNVDGLSAVAEGPEYATLVGMVRYGFKSGEREAPFSLRQWLKEVFRFGGG